MVPSLSVSLPPQRPLAQQMGKVVWRGILLRIQGVDTAWAARCPVTMASVPKDSPFVMFSVLEPGEQIEAHKGEYHSVLRYHLALYAPENPSAFLLVNNIPYEWKTGDHVMFDDTFLHSVHNPNKEHRIVLFVDVPRPFPRCSWAGFTQWLVYKVISPRCRSMKETLRLANEASTCVQRRTVN